MVNIIIKGSKTEHRPKANNKKVFFPKKSHAGYYDESFGRKFYSEKHKRTWMNDNGFIEAPRVTRAHQRRVKDFVDHWKNERTKDPNYTMRNEQYPD